METSPPPIPPRNFKYVPHRPLLHIQEQCILCTADSLPLSYEIQADHLAGNNYDELLESMLEETQTNTTSTIMGAPTKLPTTSNNNGFQSLQSSPCHRRANSHEKSPHEGPIFAFTVSNKKHSLPSTPHHVGPKHRVSQPPASSTLSHHHHLHHHPYQPQLQQQAFFSTSTIPKFTVIRDYIEENPIVCDEMPFNASSVKGGVMTQLPPQDMCFYSSHSEDDLSAAASAVVVVAAAASSSTSHDLPSSIASHLPGKSSLQADPSSSSTFSSSHSSAPACQLGGVVPPATSPHATPPFPGNKSNTFSLRLKSTSQLIRSRMSESFRKLFHLQASPSSADKLSSSPPATICFRPRLKLFKSPRHKSQQQSGRLDVTGTLDVTASSNATSKAQELRGINSAFQTPVSHRRKCHPTRGGGKSSVLCGDNNNIWKRRSRSESELFTTNDTTAHLHGAFAVPDNPNSTSVMDDFIEVFNQQTHERDLAQRVNPHLLLEKEVERQHHHQQQHRQERQCHPLPECAQRCNVMALPPPLPPKANRHVSCSQPTPAHSPVELAPPGGNGDHHHPHTMHHRSVQPQVLISASTLSSVVQAPLPLLPPPQLPSPPPEDDYNNEELSALIMNEAALPSCVLMDRHAEHHTMLPVLSKPSFTDNMARLKKMGCYWGPLSQSEVTELLMRYRDGTFLLRDSEHVTYLLSAGLKANGRVFHARIEYSKGEFCLASHRESPRSTCIQEFIHLLMEQSSRGDLHFILNNNPIGQDAAIHPPPQPPPPAMDQPLIQVVLLYPLSRFSVVQSLNHLCRFEILLRIRHDHIDKLPLPNHLKRYLQEPQYYAEMLDKYQGDLLTE